MKITISVLIPAYNVEKYLSKSVMSILRQQDPRCVLEVIIVDNQSTDGSFQVAKELQETYPDIIKAFQNVENRGIAYSMNRLWEKSQSEYSIILHADNELIDGGFSLFIDYLESADYQCGIVFGDLVYIDSSDNVIGSWKADHLGVRRLSNKNYIENYICKDGSRVRPLQFLMDRKTYEKMGPYLEDYFLEDWEYTLRCLCGTDFHRIDAPLVNFRDRPDSTGHKPEIYADSLMDVLEIHEENVYKKFGITPKTIYTNTLCRIIIMFIHQSKLDIALKKFLFYKKKYGEKINSFEVFTFSLLVLLKHFAKSILAPVRRIQG
jgi:glycosyltransferase involved in cell wall biosynthesis